MKVIILFQLRQLILWLGDERDIIIREEKKRSYYIVFIGWIASFCADYKRLILI